MSKIVDNEEYLSTQEVMTELSASKKLFYSNVKPRLKTYFFDAKKAHWFKKSDVLALKSGKLTRMASIGLIGGIQRDWSTTLKSLGYRVRTESGDTNKDAHLPSEIAEAFKLLERGYVSRPRKTFADDIPICTWSTYYPLELVEGDILDDMLQGKEIDVVARIKAKHGVIIGVARERYLARTASIDEQQSLQLLTNDPVLILQRASYTKDKRTLVCLSDMVLLGSWFAPEHEYDVNIWD